MLATAGSCLFGLFRVLRPPRQILVVRKHNLSPMRGVIITTVIRTLPDVIAIGPIDIAVFIGVFFGWQAIIN